MTLETMEVSPNATQHSRASTSSCRGMRFAYARKYLLRSSEKCRDDLLATQRLLGISDVPFSLLGALSTLWARRIISSWSIPTTSSAFVKSVSRVVVRDTARLRHSLCERHQQDVVANVTRNRKPGLAALGGRGLAHVGHLGLV